MQAGIEKIEQPEEESRHQQQQQQQQQRKKQHEENSKQQNIVSKTRPKQIVHFVLSHHTAVSITRV